MITAGVVGSGVIGASVAFCLTQRGVRVHCVERARPGGLTTDVSFARLSAFQQSTYTGFELSHAGIIEHASFAKQFGSAPWWHPTGGLAWADSDGRCGVGDPSFVADVDRLRSWGYRVAWCDAAKVQREWEPGIAFSPSQAPVALFPDEGWIDGPLLVSSLLHAAKAAGDLTFWHAAVEGIEVRDTRVTALRLGKGKRIRVDAVVNAAGPQAPAVAATLGTPMLGGLSDRRGLVIDLATDGDPVRHVLRGADLHARPAGPGRVRVRSEHVDASLTSETQLAAGRDAIENLLERSYRAVPALKASTVDRARIGTAVFPGDGMPSVGALSAVSGYYEAFANSGIILAPFIGRTLATQIVTGEIHPLLRECSPDRLRVAVQ